MLNNRHFYHEIIKKNVKAFGTIFNNIQIEKTNPETGEVIRQEKVPLAYGPKSKFLARLQQDPSTERKVSITMPRISFEMTDITYDAARKTSPIQKYLKEEDGETVRVQYMPVPYNLRFELGILARNQDDALQILEQILPYFQPSFNVTVNLIPEMDEKKDLPIILNGISYEDDYEDDMLRRRSVTYTLDFTLKTYMYGPVTNSNIIRKATVFESIGDLDQHKRYLRYDVSPQALEDENGDGVIDSDDDLLLMPGDDFGFNEGIEYL
jgi:hypothetical protein